jgi:hypothetical protein
MERPAKAQRLVSKVLLVLKAHRAKVRRERQPRLVRVLLAVANRTAVANPTVADTNHTAAKRPGS